MSLKINGSIINTIKINGKEIFLGKINGSIIFDNKNSKTLTISIDGKNNITITNGLGVVSRVLCYDADKNFMTNWSVSSEGSYSYRHVQDGHDLNIPEGCYYIKIRFASTEVKPITIGYND